MKRLYRAFEERDSETPFEIYAPDAEWDTRRYSPAGIEGVRVHDQGRAHHRVEACGTRERALEVAGLRQ